MFLPFQKINLYSLSLTVQAAISNYHRLGGLNHKQFRRLGNPRSRWQQIQCLVRVYKQPPFHCISHGRGQTSSRVLIKALVSFIRAPVSWPNYLPTSNWGLGFQHMNFRGKYLVRNSLQIIWGERGLINHECRLKDLDSHWLLLTCYHSLPHYHSSRESWCCQLLILFRILPVG